MTGAPTENLSDVIEHSGVVTRKRKRSQFTRGEILRNGAVAELGDLVQAGDLVSVQGLDYVLTPGGLGRLQLCPQSIPTDQIVGPIRVHCGYHKCLTEYSKKVYRAVCNSFTLPHGSFRHFFHRLDSFYSDCRQHTISSISGHYIDLDRFEDIRIVRFIRDPRDLLVSGYYYHKRGAEAWCHLKNPEDIDWMIVNGCVPRQLSGDQSMMEFLNSISLEDGLLAEMDFRANHFASMRQWPMEDSRVRLFRYEDIIGNESRVFLELLDFFGMKLPARIAGALYARRFRAGAIASKKKHIRNPASGQWQRHFTRELKREFNLRYGDILEQYGYPVD